MQVTQYPHIKTSTNGTDRPLPDVLADIKNGRWADEVNKYRETKDKKIKEGLPYITSSGTFNRRKADSIKEHNGTICIDFDHLEDVEAAKAKLCADPYTLSVFVSAGGQGLACFVKIHSTQHSESFELLTYYYKKHYNLETDPACSDVSRARFVSFDEGLCYYPKSRVFNEQQVSKASGTRSIDSVISMVSDKLVNAPKGSKHNERLKMSRLLGGYVGGGHLTYGEAFDVLTSSVQASGTPDMVTATRTIESGMKYGMDAPLKLESNSTYNFTQQQAPDTSAREIYKLARDDNRAGKEITDEYLHGICGEYLIRRERVQAIYDTIYEQFKDEHDLKNAPRIRKIEHFINQAYEFKCNEITQRAEMRRLPDGEYKGINNCTIWRYCQHNWEDGKAPGMDTIKALLDSDFVPIYNPFIDYFNSLDKWDGKTDHINKLSSYMKVEDQAFYQTQFKKAMVRSIACSLFNIENRIVFVFVGEKQETGKSTFIRFLNPFGNQYYTEAPIQDNKDTSIRLSENFIYNIEELASMSNMDVNKLKALISTFMVKERKAYGRDEVQQPRRCNFFASTNKNEFLTDTENTRWLCFNVTGISWDYTKQVNIHQVWAQAFSLYKSGFDYTLTQNEKDIRDAKNKSYEVQTSENDMIRLWFSQADKGNEWAEFMSATDILQKLSSEAPALRLTSRGVGRALKSLGFESEVRKIGNKAQRGYWVKVQKQQIND